VAIPSNKPQNRILLVGGIIFALLAGVVVFLAVSKSSSTSTSQTPSVPVVVAATTISAGSQLSVSNLTTTLYVPADVPDGAYTTTSLLIGKTVAVDISAKTPITPQLLGAASGSSGTTAATSSAFTIAEGYVALAIPASGSAAGTSVDQMTVGYYIQAGNQIDIIADLGGSTTTSYAVTYAFQDVPVLAVGRSASAATGASPAASAAATVSAPTYFIVEMPRYQAEMLTAILSGNFAQSSGTPPVAGNAPVVLKYVLRPIADYGTLTVDNKANPPTASFTPKILPLPSGDTEPVTPSQLAQALGG
jgi:Flp pilus assembly protein CpaB